MKRRIFCKSGFILILALVILLAMGVSWHPGITNASGGMKLAISSAKLGNIFADGDPVAFTLTFTNSDATARTMNCTWTALDQNGVQVNNGSFQQSIGASATAVKTLTLSVTGKGVYTLSVHASARIMRSTLRRPST